MSPNLALEKSACRQVHSVAGRSCRKPRFREVARLDTTTDAYSKTFWRTHERGVMNAESTTIHCRFPSPVSPRTKVAAETTRQARNHSANHRSKAGVAAVGLVPTPMKKISNATVASISDNHPSALRRFLAGRCLRRSTQTQKIKAGFANFATPTRLSTAVPKSLPSSQNYHVP